MLPLARTQHYNITIQINVAYYTIIYEATNSTQAMRWKDRSLIWWRHSWRRLWSDRENLWHTFYFLNNKPRRHTALHSHLLRRIIMLYSRWHPPQVSTSPHSLQDQHLGVGGVRGRDVDAAEGVPYWAVVYSLCVCVCVCVCVNWVLGIVAFRLKFPSLNMNPNPNPVTWCTANITQMYICVYVHRIYCVLRPACTKLEEALQTSKTNHKSFINFPADQVSNQSEH